MPAAVASTEGLSRWLRSENVMAREQSLADQLVFFLRMRDESAAKIEAMDKTHECWGTLQVLLDQQSMNVRDAILQAAATAERVGRLAAHASRAEEA